MKTSHLQCQISQVPYVCHHLVYTGHDIHNFWQPLLLMTSHALYSFHHMHYIWHLIYSVWCHIHYVCYITLWPYLWHQTIYVYVIFYWYGSGTVLWPQNHCVPSQPLCLTLHSVYFWHYTKYTNFLKEVNVCHHSLYKYDTICTTYDITSTLADNTPLFLCHGTNSVYDIICIIYDVTHTVCMTKQALYLTWNTLKLTSLPLHMSSHPLFWRHHTYSVRYHRWHTYAIIWFIHDMISTLYNNLYYLWYHMHYIHSITRIIYYISSTLYDVTFTMCVTSHNDPIYGIKQNMFMLYSLDMAKGTGLWRKNHCVPSQPLCLTLHSMYFWHYTQYTNFLKRSECMSSQPL